MRLMVSLGKRTGRKVTGTPITRSLPASSTATTDGRHLRAVVRHHEQRDVDGRVLGQSRHAREELGADPDPGAHGALRPVDHDAGARVLDVARRGLELELRRGEVDGEAVDQARASRGPRAPERVARLDLELGRPFLELERGRVQRHGLAQGAARGRGQILAQNRTGGALLDHAHLDRRQVAPRARPAPP